MNTKLIFELSMHIDNNAFTKIIRKLSPDLCQLPDNDDEYFDNSMISKGIAVKFRNSTYKKKITLVINAAQVLDTPETDSEKLCRKINKRILKYFDNEYTIDDFCLSGAAIVTDIDVGCRTKVSSYIKTLKRIRMVKRFSPAHYDGIDDSSSLCLKGNSSGVDFMIYDLEKRLADCSSQAKLFKGFLRAEVHLTSKKAVSQVTQTTEAALQIMRLAERSEQIFLEVFSHIVPYGDFYKKGRANELVKQKVKNGKLKRHMLNLIALIPEKKSLLLAQKALNLRHIDDVMEEFAAIGLSPITISKRSGEDRLENLYEFLRQ
jgi:hypothetical protein